MHRFFAATARFAVRFRWPVVAAWVAATVLANLFFPSLASVAKQSNTSILPASSPSLQAARLATPFQGVNQTPVLVVIARSRGELMAADLTAARRLTASLAKVGNVQKVSDLGMSRDRQAVQLEVLATINLGTQVPPTSSSPVCAGPSGPAHCPAACTSTWLACWLPRRTPASLASEP